MSDVTKPIALDESINTTENTPRNIADVLADELSNIADKIQGGGSGGSGGHIIQNASGANLTQRNTMQFVDSHVTDDSQNDKTKVEVVKSVASADYSSETEDGLYLLPDGDGSVIEPASEDYVEVTADGIKTYATLLNELYALIDFNKVSKNAILTLNGLIYNPIIIQNDGYYFSRVGIENNLPAIFEIGVRESNSYYNFYQNNQYTNRTNDPVPVGTKIIFHYGNKKAVVDLQTTANRCWYDSNNTVKQELDNLNRIANSVITANDVKISDKRYRTIFSTGNIVTGAWTNLGTLSGKTTQYSTAVVDFNSSIAITNESGNTFHYPLFQNAVGLFTRINPNTGSVQYYTTNSNITGFRLGVEYIK